MYHRIASQLVGKAAFEVINLVVHFEQVARCGYLGVEGDHASARTVVMHYEVMYSQNAFAGENDIRNFIGQFLFGRLAEERVDRVIHGFQSGVKNEQRHRRTAVGVGVDVGKICYGVRNENNTC